jgi:large subunit ribosomal protein L44e
VKIPKQIRAYCPSCRKHTPHKVHRQGKGSARSLSWGQRQFARVISGYGGQPRPEQKSLAKVTKKAVLVLECTECKKKHARRGFRTKKLEIGE